MILLEKNFDCNGIILGKTVVFNSYPRNNFKNILAYTFEHLNHLFYLKKITYIF